MGTRRMLCVMVIVLLLLGTSYAKGEAAVASSYWQRMGQGFANQVIVYEQIYEYQAEDLEIKARIPQLFGTFDVDWQMQFNKSIQDQLVNFVDDMQEIAEEWRSNHPHEGIVDFELKFNQGGLLSIAIVVYTYTGGAHGMTVYDYRNIDLTTGQELSFYDLFASEEELGRAAAAIDEAIVEDPDWYFIDRFTQDLFTVDQGFYLQADHVVICFGLYEIAPYAAGIQEFNIMAP